MNVADRLLCDREDTCDIGEGAVDIVGKVEDLVDVVEV